MTPPGPESHRDAPLEPRAGKLLTVGCSPPPPARSLGPGPGRKGRVGASGLAGDAAASEPALGLSEASRGGAGREGEVAGREGTLVPGGASAPSAVGAREVEAGRPPTSRVSCGTPRARGDLRSAATPGASGPGGPLPSAEEGPLSRKAQAGPPVACHARLRAARSRTQSWTRTLTPGSQPGPARPAELREPRVALSPPLLQTPPPGTHAHPTQSG